MDAATIEPLLQRYRELRATWRTLTKELEEKTSKRRELAMRADQLSFALNEIDAVAPTPGEDEELAASIRRLQDVDGLRDAALSALGPSMVWPRSRVRRQARRAPGRQLLGQAAAELAGASDAQLRNLSEQVSEITAQLSDVSAELGSFIAALPEAADSLDSLMQRQADLKTLTRKYAPDIAGVLAWRDKAERKLATLDVSGEALEALQNAITEQEKKLSAAATKLTRARARAAKRLEEAVTGELAGLAMAHTQLVVELGALDTFGPSGRMRWSFDCAPTLGLSRAHWPLVPLEVSSHALCWRWKWCSRLGNPVKLWSLTRSTPVLVAGRPWRSASVCACWPITIRLLWSRTCRRLPHSPIPTCW